MINLTLDKTSYAPGAEIYVTVEADTPSPTVPVDYTITASRTVDGVEESESVVVTVNYPKVVSAIAVAADGGLQMAPAAGLKNVWGGRIPTEPAA